MSTNGGSKCTASGSEPAKGRRAIISIRMLVQGWCLPSSNTVLAVPCGNRWHSLPSADHQLLRNTRLPQWVACLSAASTMMARRCACAHPSLMVQ